MDNLIKRFLCLAISASLLVPPAVFAAEDAQTISRSAADYAGRGSVIAVVDAGFDTAHPAFASSPAGARLTAADGGEYYISEKIPYARDYADGDGDVSNTSFSGTAAASLAAGYYEGGDEVQPDGTVTHDASFAGAAAGAQLLLMKAAADSSARLGADAVSAAIRDAVRLGADAIVLNAERVNSLSGITDAVREAKAAGIPVLAGAGDCSENAAARLPVTVTDRGTLAAVSALEEITLVGIAADPFAGVSSFLAAAPGEEALEIPYTDSCADYFGKSFAALFAGREIPLAAVPGVGRAEDYADIDVRDKIAVVARGEITFTEKAQAAADAGALALIVTDAGEGGVRMSLDGAPIPAVMVDAEAGARLTEENLSAVFREGRLSPSSRSASGLSRSLSRTVSFLCAGDGVIAAVPAEQHDGEAYARVSGSYYAAAAAAGYVARAAEYCRAAGIGTSYALALTAGSAAAAMGEGGDPLSCRAAGAGVVSGEGTYPLSTASTPAGDAVSALGDTRYTTVSFTVSLTNTSDKTKLYSLSARVYGDAYETENGTAYLTGESEPLTAARVYAGDSGVNIARTGGSHSTASVTVGAHKTVNVRLRLTVPDAARRELKKTFLYGFYADGVIEADDGEETVLHAFTAFFGNWEEAPLADPSAYTGEAAVFAPATLYARRFDGGDDSLLPLGTANPFISGGEYDAAYNTVNPALLRLGWVELRLCALRDIDRIEIAFYDSERRLVFSRETGGAAKYLRGGETVLPLWDFIAEDNEDYLFPDGEYFCEIRLSSAYPPEGSAVQFLGFSFTVDSAAPRAGLLTAERDGDTLLLAVSASDDTALLSISAYDAAFSFSEVSDAEIAGKRKAEARFDLTQYDGSSPLYVEITDRAGNYTVVRLSPGEVAALAAEAGT